jgi:hypothetical protein
MVKEAFMKKSIIIFLYVCTIFLSLLSSSALALNLTDKLTVSGFIKNETAVKLDDPDKFMKIENMFQLEVEYRLNPHITLFGIVREWYDSAYDAEEDWEPNRKIMCRTKGTDWLREVYIDYYSNKFDVRIGKQQVVWGTADGVKILDAVCPTDMREFYLDNFADSRIPLYMLKLEYSPKVDGTLQFLVVPDFEPNFTSPAGSPFTFQKVKESAEKQQELIDLYNFSKGVHEKYPRLPNWLFNYSGYTWVNHDPGQSLKNAKIGVRWLDVFKGIEYTFNYLHGWDMSPAVKVKYQNFTPYGDVPVNFTKVYGQTELFGTSFSKALNSGPLRGLTIRGEFAYIHNHKNNYGDAGDKVTKVDNFNYVIGLDKYIWTNWLFSFQFIQFISSIDTKHGEPLIFGATGAPLDKIENTLSLKISTDFFHERLKAEVLTLYGDDNNWRTSPRLEYEIRDYLTMAAGIHAFWGPKNSLYGEFRDSDEIYLELKYGF